MDQYSSVDMDFGECNDFLESLHSDSQSQSSTSPFAFTPSPQDILNNPYGDSTNPYGNDGWALNQFFGYDGSPLQQAPQQQQPPPQPPPQQQKGQQHQQMQVSSTGVPLTQRDSSSSKSPSYKSNEIFQQFPQSEGYTMAKELESNNSQTSSPNLFNSRTQSVSSYNSDTEANFNSYSGSNSSSRIDQSASYPFTPPLSGIQSRVSGSDNEKSLDAIREPPFYKSIKEEALSPGKSLESSSVTMSKKAGGPGKVVKPKRVKCSHNVIEKRYRSNINDKILALRDCVPSLRVKVSGDVDDPDLDGLAPAMKLNKATVLTKATEYILHLQKRNALLVRELQELRAVYGNGSANGSNGDNLQRPESDSSSPSSGISSFQAYPDYQQDSSNNRNAVSKGLMCTMATMMGAGLYNEATAGSNQRGLSAFPLPSIRFWSNNNFSIIQSFKLFLIIGTFVYVFLPSLFPQSKSSVKHGNQNRMKASSSLQALRIDTWLTSSQVWNISFASDTINTIIGINLRLFQILFSYVFGVEGLALLFGLPVDDTETPFKVIDSQLTGGDVHASKLRVLYTFLSSSLCRATTRLQMIHALQAEILLHDYLPSKYSNIISRLLWDRARKSYNSIAISDSREELPTNLLNLLNCDDVFQHDTVQRAYNLCFGLPSSQNCKIGYRDMSLDVVCEDERLGCILSLLASWYTNRLLQESLVEYLESGTVNKAKLDLCQMVAPESSRVHIRVCVIRSLLLDLDASSSELQNAISLIANELQIPLPFEKQKSLVDDDSDHETDGQDSTEESEISSSSSITEDGFTYLKGITASARARVPEDCRTTAHISLLLYALKNSPKKVESIFSKLPVVALDLLSFIAVSKMLGQLKTENFGIDYSKLEALAASARIWIGSEDAKNQNLSLSKRRDLVGKCIKLGAFFGGIDLDEGYGSNSNI